MIECINFRSYKKNSLLGFADFYVPKWDLEIFGCPLYQKDGKRWISMPTKEYEKDGEKKYLQICRFREKDHWDAFCEAAKKAIDKWCSANATVQEDIPF